MILLGAFILITYLLTMGILVFGYNKVTGFNSEKIQPETKFSIIIPFRNEADNLSVLLQSIIEIKYPNHFFEVIFIDDESKDNSVLIINEALQSSSVSYKVLKNERLSASPKKDAITLGISKSNLDWILTTDADCILPKNWLGIFDAFIQKNNTVCIAAPVNYQVQKGLLYHFQELENFSLQTTTIACFGLNIPLLCNGANFAYKKEVFYKVSGFSGNSHIASGDDIFLLEKMKKHYPSAIHFLKSEEAVITTKSQENWKQIIAQRVRWASKTSKQQSVLSKVLGSVVLLCSLFFLVGGIYSLLHFTFLPYYALFLLLKFGVDYAMIKKSSAFFKKKIMFSSFILSGFIYPFITVIIVFRSGIGSYSWKGRNYVSSKK